MTRDVSFLRSILRDAQAMRWLSPDGKVIDEDRVVWLTGRLAAHWQAHDFGVRLFFWPDETGHPVPAGQEPLARFAGWCGLRHQVIDGRPEIELLYALRPAFWRQGLGSDMARACLEEGFQAMGVASVIAFTLPDNLGSRGVMEACGMQIEGSIIHAGLPHVLYRRTHPSPG